jgi:hypothetical protein
MKFRAALAAAFHQANQDRRYSSISEMVLGKVGNNSGQCPHSQFFLYFLRNLMMQAPYKKYRTELGPCPNAKNTRLWAAWARLKPA